MCSQAQEPKLGFLVTNDFAYQRNRLANEPNQVYNSSSVFAKWGNWSGGATLRAFNFYRQASNWTLANAKVDLYRKYGQYTGKSFEFQFGDFKAVLGRGLVLSVAQNEKIFRDRTVMGGSFLYRDRGWIARALGGNVHDETGEREWRVAAAELERDYWRGNWIGVRASYIRDVKALLIPGERLTWSVNWNSDRLPLGLSYYVEVGRLKHLDLALKDGTGLYSNVGWTRNRVTLLAEYRKYKNFDNELNNPPSADRGDEGFDLYDSETLRLYTQYSFFTPDIVAFLSLGRAREGNAVGPQIYGGVNASDLVGRLDFSFSYEVKKTFYPIKIAEAHGLYRFAGKLAAEVSARDRRYNSFGDRFQEDDFVPQFSWAPFGALFYQFQYSLQLVEERHYFHSAGIRINLKQDSYLEVSAGATRGGQVCSAGQCIFLPPFRGLKIGLFTAFRR